MLDTARLSAASQPCRGVLHHLTAPAAPAAPAALGEGAAPKPAQEGSQAATEPQGDAGGAAPP